MSSTVHVSTPSSTSQGRAEVPRTLAEPAPRALGVLDQFGLWGNLGVSLLGFTGALVVLQPGGPGTPRLSLAAALLAIVVGTVLGAAAVAVSALPGAQTGAPAMVLLRGLFGARPSYVPTVLNIVQMLGWGTFELVTIATAAGAVLPGIPRWVYVLIGGVITTVLAVYPLGAVRVLRRYVTAAVVIALAYLCVQLLRHPLPALTAGTWSGFSVGVDTTVAADADHVFAAFIAVPLGGLAFMVLAVREVDQSFANVYSTSVSTQNLRPRWDRRLISVVIGVAITVLALAVNIYGYASFLSLIGSLFVPMFAVLAVDYFLFAGRSKWDLTATARPRWVMLAPWAAGFVTYQLIYPGQVSWWATAWGELGHAIGFTAQPWMSASLLFFFFFVAAAAATALLGGAARLTGSRP